VNQTLDNEVGQGVDLGIVTASRLNMRSSPGGPVIRVLAHNHQVEVLSRAGSWLKISDAALGGYVSSRYLRVSKAIEPQTPVQQVGVVSTSLLNLRSQPGGTIISQLGKSTVVTIIAKDGLWLQVTANGIQGFVSADYIDIQPLPEAVIDNSADQGFRLEGRKALAPDGSYFATRTKNSAGLFNTGKTGIAAFIANNPDRFPDISSSLLRVMSAVSDNEGNYEAINTWDNAFLSAGIFQWTSGVGSEAGELPAVLDKLNQQYPDTFEEFFGQYGLTTSQIRSSAGNPGRGYFTLNGSLLAGQQTKTTLRSLPWAYRFWLAGQDDNVREVQTRHAIDRIDLFYHQANRKIGDFFVSDYISSEYGVCLLLDQHVNRPAHVPRILGEAVKKLAQQLAINEPETWQSEHEAVLIEKYLQLRQQSSMTHSDKRAEKILDKVTAAVISSARYSFQYG
jgi:uncharacterized protein YraI